MLTAFQCEVVAYLGDGDIYCPDCAVDAGCKLSDGIIRYSLDEMQAERNVDYQQQGDWPEGCTDDCEPFVEVCGGCGDELGEPYHYGHDTDEPQNPPVPRWAPCSQCGAGDGEPHRYGCTGILTA